MLKNDLYGSALYFQINIEGINSEHGSIKIKPDNNTMTKIPDTNELSQKPNQDC